MWSSSASEDCLYSRRNEEGMIALLLTCVNDLINKKHLLKTLCSGIEHKVGFTCVLMGECAY